MFQKERQRRHVAGSVRSATPEPAGSPPSPGLMGTPKHGQPGPTRRPLGMVVVLLALLTAVSLPRTGQATLRCHICEEENNFNCTGPQTCSAADQFCILAAIPNPGGILVMKSCAPTCPNSTVSSDGRALSVFCCEGNHCNRSAASGLTSSLGALWASASASLLWALLRAAW
ncbi:lymphocyte antigen 6E-like isoform X3 [Onychomys torridus]|uniref:lymphocyte antigen 6E-like isoform X3 n=1 Tax=Onychomys torridus TaxID=38674 RepID=UPI00167F3B01|nr:lymphocyte antigen 6E-like isoform X3 [Onychomys torridus]